MNESNSQKMGTIKSPIRWVAMYCRVATHEDCKTGYAHDIYKKGVQNSSFTAT